jgi:hypothetical protein
MANVCVITIEDGKMQNFGFGLGSKSLGSTLTEIEVNNIAFLSQTPTTPRLESSSAKSIHPP